MPDFKSMLTEAKSQFEEAAEEAKKKRDTEAERRSAFVDRAVAVLETHIEPLLRQAETEFATEQLTVEIKRIYDVKNYVSDKVRPMISFKVLGPKRTGDGWRQSGIPVFFESDGDQLFAGTGAYSFDDKPKESLGTKSIDESSILVSQLVKRALDSYFKELKDSPSCHFR